MIFLLKGSDLRGFGAFLWFPEPRRWLPVLDGAWREARGVNSDSWPLYSLSAFCMSVEREERETERTTGGGRGRHKVKTEKKTRRVLY